MISTTNSMQIHSFSITYMLMHSAQGVWLNNQVNKHTITWGVLREDLDRLENKLQDKDIPLMHTWGYQQSARPNTTAHKHPFHIVEVTTGYKWNMDVARDSLQDVLSIMKKFDNLQNGALVPTLCHRQSCGNYSHDKMVGFFSLYWDHFNKAHTSHGPCAPVQLGH